MAAEPLPGGSGDGPVPVVDGIEDPFGLLSGEPAEAEATEEQAPETEEAPEEQPDEAEAEDTEAPSEDAPALSATEDTPEVDEATASRWLDLVTKSVNTGRPQFSQIPAHMRDWAVAQFEGKARDLAQQALDAWRNKVSFTPEDIEEVKQQAKQEALQESEVSLQQRQYEQQLLSYFGQYDPTFNDNADKFDLFEVAEEYPQQYQQYLALKQRELAKTDPVAQMEKVANERAFEAQKALTQGILGALLRRPDIAGAPGVKEKMAAFEEDPSQGVVKAFGHPENLEGYVATLHSLFDAAVEAEATRRATKKVLEQKGAISEAAAREAKAKLRGALPRADSVPGTGGSGYSAEKLSDPQFWADMSTKSPEEQARAQQAYDRLNLGTPLRRR